MVVRAVDGIGDHAKQIPSNPRQAVGRLVEPRWDPDLVQSIERPHPLRGQGVRLEERGADRRRHAPQPERLQNVGKEVHDADRAISDLRPLAFAHGPGRLGVDLGVDPRQIENPHRDLRGHEGADGVARDVPVAASIVDRAGPVDSGDIAHGGRGLTARTASVLRLAGALQGLLQSRVEVGHEPLPGEIPGSRQTPLAQPLRQISPSQRRAHG